MEVKERYTDWVKQIDEKPAFSLRKTVLRLGPPDYKKSFDEAREPSEKLPS
jgi:hypothetical protein